MDILLTTEEEICKELNSQGVTRGKRFTTQEAGNILKLNTYLLPFNTTTLPWYIYFSPYTVNVDLCIPGPKRFFLNVKTLVQVQANVKIFWYVSDTAARVMKVSNVAA